MLHLRNVLVLESLKPTGVKLCHLLLKVKPLTDLCCTCQQISRLIAKSSNSPEHLKIERVNKALEHLDQTHKERKFYMQTVTVEH